MRFRGQYLVLRCLPDKNSPPVVRSYSISGASDAGTYRISVKRGTGPGSRHIVDATRAGDKWEISAPRGEFVFATEREAGGSIERRNWGHPGSFHAARSCDRKCRISPGGLVDPCCAQCGGACLCSGIPRTPGRHSPKPFRHRVQRTKSDRPARRRFRHSRTLGPCDSGETRHSRGSGLLCVWTIGVSERYEPRSHLLRSTAKCDTSGSIWRGQQHRARRNQDGKKASAFSGSRWDRTHRLVYAKRPGCAMGYPIQQHTRIG